MAYIINRNGLTELTFTVNNTTLQTITAGTQIPLQQSSGRPFAVIGASVYYTNATTVFNTSVNAGFVLLNVSAGQLFGIWQDPSATKIDIAPGRAFSFVVNYDPSGPQYSGLFRDDDIGLVFDGDYTTGDGELVIKIVGFYF